MTTQAFQKWQQFVALAVICLSLGLSQAQAAAFNINTASSTEIEKNLDGVGPVKAKAIVDYRQKNGAFKNTDDLLKVPGIGAGTVRKNLSTIGLKRGKMSLKASSSVKSSGKAKATSKASTAKSTSKSKKSAANTKITTSSSALKNSATKVTPEVNAKASVGVQAQSK